MTTIARLAAEYDMQPYELVAYADLDPDFPHTSELDADSEAFIRDLLDRSENGIYTA